jgi:hypothetical protein
MAKIQINLRGEESLKEQLTGIAKRLDTSMNDVAIRGLEEFVKRFEIEQVADDAIPNREQIEAALLDIKKEITTRCRNRVKFALNEMVQSVKTSILVDLFEGESLDIGIKKEIVKNISQELEKLGYFVHVFREEDSILSVNDEKLPFHFYPFLIGITLNKEDISYYQETEEKFSIMPF